MTYKPDHYHQTNPPCELKRDVMGRQGSKKGQKESTTEPAGSDAATCSASSDRALVCCFCGKAWSYDGHSPTEPLMKEACDHEKVCEKNPYLHEITQLRNALMLACRWGVSSDGHSSEVADRLRNWVIKGMKGEAPTQPDYYPPNVKLNRRP